MCRDTTDYIITEELSGYIDLKDNCFHTIWKAVGLNAFVTIKMKNMSDYLIKLRINKKKCITEIDPKDEKTITIPNVHNLSVQCDKDITGTCYGSYQMIIHYPLDFDFQWDCYNSIKCNKNTIIYKKIYPL